MLTTTIHYGLLIALAIALVFAAFTDIRRRQIDNWLNAAIALGAPLFWWSSGLALWPDVAMQLGVALAAFVRRKARERSAGISGQLAGHGVKQLPDLVVVVLGPEGQHQHHPVRIDEFDLDTEAYTGQRYHYVLEAEGTNIGDMVAIDDQRFIVIERNGATATNGGTPFKKLFLVDLSGVAPGGTVQKTELVDLMNLADPHDLNGDGSQVFTLPYVTIENVTVIDERTLLVANDNNFPYGGGRALAADDTEFLRIRLPVSLAAGR